MTWVVTRKRAGLESSLYDVYHILLNKSMETINLSHSSVSKAKYGNFSDHARFEVVTCP